MLAEDLGHALYASKIVSYAQGFAQMAAASEAEGWRLDLGGHGDDLAGRLHYPGPASWTASARPTTPSRIWRT